MKNYKNHETSMVYTKIYDILKATFPKAWKNIVFYTILNPTSYSMKYFVDFGDGMYIDCFSLQKTDIKKLHKSFMNVYKVLSTVRNQLPQKDQWTTFVFMFNAEGKFKVNYSYDDVSLVHNKEIELEKQIYSNCYSFDSVSKSAPKSEVDMSQKMCDIENALIAAKNDLNQLNDNFRDLISKTIELENTLNTQQYELGVKKMCIITEKLKRICSEHTDILSDEMEFILKNHFNVTEICPSEGAAFDSAEHERKDDSQIGKVIRSCVMKGWKTKERILIRAIVETK